jgi:hypothetical protein
MDNMIILNVKTPVNLREIYVIERVTARDRERIAGKTGGDIDRLAAFQSNVRFIDGTNMLVTQSFEEIAAKADRRFVTVRMEEGQAAQIVPIDAIRHFERVKDADRQAMKQRYDGTDPARIDALQTRIVYGMVDPHTVEPRRAFFFQKMFPVDIEADIGERQKRQVIDIGNGRFLLASEIASAKDLTEAELASLADRYNLRSDDGELVTSVTLRSGDLILSPFPADDITGQIKRPAPRQTPPRRLAAAGRRAAMK